MADQPSIIPSAWAANNSTTETIPAITTESGKASWDQGFPVETSLPLSEGGIPPKYGDFNGVLNVLSQFCLFAQAGGQFAWNATLDYSVGSIVLGTDGSIYRAAQVSGPSTTAVNPVGDTSGKWERIVSQSDINALEQEISDAMDAAEDAASNASAAQSAVTTLDANVVKLSGNQTVGGTKTFTSEPVVYTSSPNMTFKSSDLIQASDPNTNRYIYPIRFMDKNGTFLGYLEFLVGSGGNRRVGIATYKQDGTATYLRLGFDTGGTPYITWDDKSIINGSDDQTVGGTKTFSDWMKAKGFYQSVANGSVTVAGGAGIGANDGAKLTLYGKNEATDPGEFKLLAGNATAYKILNGSPDGTLTWDSKDIITNGGNQTVGGEKTFSSPIVITDNIGLRKANNSGEMWITAGTSTNAAYGARLGLWGADHATASDKGAFQLQAGNANGHTRLVGKPDGTLTWGSSNVITSAGGTMTGFLTRNGDLVKSGSASGQIAMYNGSSAADGAGIWLYGKSHSTRPSWINLQTYTTAYHALVFDGTAFCPAENSTDLGKNNSTNRWKNEYFQTNPNVSSDERIKSSIGSIPDDVLDAWADVNWSQFQMNDAIEEKGINNARLHTGVVAQRVRDAFSAHDLDATRYGLFCYDEWSGKPEERDEKGEVISEAVEAGNQYSIRYGEALCMEAAYQRRRADRAEARISSLERRLAEMEAVLASLLSPVGDETYAEPEQEQDAEQEGEE